MCMVYIREDIIPDYPVQSLCKVLGILIVSRNVDFDDTREVLLIGY